MNKIDRGLASKYDILYANDTSKYQDVAPIKTRKGWPTNRYDMLTFLARPTSYPSEGNRTRLLEIGCGRGNVLASLSENYDELIGTELSGIRAEAARQYLSHLPNCQIFNGSIDELVDLDIGTFDCIIWGAVIAHIVDVIGAMHLLAKLSHEGTQLITITPNVAYLPQRVRLLRGRFPNASQPNHNNHGFKNNFTETALFDGGHLHYFTYQQVELLYEIADFKPKQRLGFGGRFSKIRNFWPTLLSGSICISGFYSP